MGFPWTELLTQSLTVAAAGIRSQSLAPGAALTSAVDLKRFRKVLFLVDIGTLGASATVDFKVQAAKTSGGTYSDVTNVKINQVTTNNHTELIEVSADHLQNLMGNGYEFLKGVCTVGTAASQVSVTVLGAIGDHEPTSNNADASLDQTVVL